MGIADKAKQVASKALDKAQDLEKKAEPYVDKAKETAGDLAQKASPHVQMATKRASTMIDKVGSSIAQGASSLANTIDKTHANGADAQVEEDADHVSTPMADALPGGGSDEPLPPADAHSLHEHDNPEDQPNN
jgi:hypothetical protein